MNTRKTSLTLASVLLGAMQTASLHAADVVKANNTDTLNLGTSWVGDVAPTSSDIAVWDNTVLAANTVALGADTSLAGISILSPGGLVTISAGNTLTLGASGVNMSAATQNLTLSAPVLLGASQDWNVASGRTITVSGGLANAGNTLTKSGAGILHLENAGTAGSLTSVNLSGGQLTFKGSAAGGSAAAISAANGTTIHLDNVGGSTNTFVSGAITAASGANVTMTSDSAGNGYSGLITGDAASTFTIGGTTQVSFSLGSSTQQFANFAGTVQIGSGASLRFSATSGLNNGGTNTTFDVAGNLTARNTGTIHVGKLTGSGTVTGSSGADNNTTTFSIGAKNETSTFSGSINDSNSIRRAAVTKVGTASLILSGASNYSGATNINAGTLFISGSKTGAGTVTVGAAGTLGGTGSITGATTVNGALRTNAAPIDAVSRLTFATSLTLAAGATTTFDIDGVNFTGVTMSTAESLTFGGALTFNFVNGVTTGTYDVFSFTDSDTGSFGQVSIASIGALSFNTGVWSGIYGGNTYTFTEATGDLVVSAIPEPSSFAALAGLVGLGLAASRRRRAA